MNEVEMGTRLLRTAMKTKRQGTRLAGPSRIFGAALGLTLAGLGLFSGCARMPVVSAPATAPAINAREVQVEITSDPAAAVILVNDQPVGHAPLRLTVKTTVQGFCSDYLTIKARFVAKDASQVSQTVETQLTPREKAPLALVFKPQGVQRRLR
jgi:hypothetical protein